MSREQEIGTLVIVVLKAQNLIDKHSFYKQDAYAKITLNGIEQKTGVDFKGGQHPVWDEELRFPIYKSTNDKHRKLEVACYSKEHRSDDLLGGGSVNITDTLKSGEFDDWVSLSIDGVARGELYLEMTFFSSGPAPVPQYSSGSLTLPTSGLLRRPSKLSPSERLSRPPQQTQLQGGRPNQGQGIHNQAKISSGGGHLQPASPPNSRPTSRPPARTDHALPPLPEADIPLPRPSSLAPAGGSRPSSSGGQPQDLPSFLRPGSGKPASNSRPAYTPSPAPVPNSIHIPEYNRYTSPPINNANYNTSPSSTPNPYLSQRTSPSRMPTSPAVDMPSIGFTPLPPPAQSYTVPVPPTSPLTWRPPSGFPPPRVGPPSVSVSFPLAMPSADVPIVQSHQPSFDPHHGPTPSIPDYRMPPYQAPVPPVPQPGPITRPQDDLPDPYLIARYQTPFPLPPGTTTTPSLPMQQREPTPPKPREPTPSPSPNQYKPTIQGDRILALQLAEEEAARRKTQEERDLELAMQLDRELNM